MRSSALAAGVRYLRGVMALHGRDQENDEQLLHAFISRRDDSAFAALVGRYGPMVMNVCSRVLGQQQDAEDAFQATFLVLARKAATLRDKTALAAFLHGTAYRMAMKAKQSAARRRSHEGQARSRSPVDPVDELSWREVRTLLDEEVAHLSEKYRSVFVLCVLEGASRDEAAKRLGLKAGTVSSRLAMARKRLGQRLARRGVELTAVLAATAVMTPPALALPAGLIAGTIKAALATAAGDGLAGIVSASVAELVQGVTAEMMVSKAKTAMGLLLTVTLLSGAGACFLASPQRQQGQPVPARRAGKKAADVPRSAKPQAANTVEIQGRVLDPGDKPKAGAKLLLLSRKGKITPLGVSAKDGRFTVAVPKETMKRGDHWLIAQADGAGIDFVGLHQFKNKKPAELRLVKDNAIRGRVVNTEGKPVRGVRVAVESIEAYGKNSLDTFRTAWINLWAGGAGTGMEKQIYSGAGALFAATTDADGRFVLQGMGAERTIRVRLCGAGIADTAVWVANRAGLDPKPYNQAVLDHLDKRIKHANWRWSLLSGPDVAVVAETEKVIGGVVADADTGKGRAGVVVRLIRDSDELVQFPPESRTDAQGRYEMHGVRKTKRYLLAVSSDSDAGYLGSQVWAEDTTGHQPIAADIRVKKGVVITGKIIDGGTGKPISGFAWPAVLAGNPFVKDYPKFRESLGLRSNSVSSDDGGTFRVVTIPGPVVLMGGPSDNPSPIYKRPLPDPKYPQYFSVRDPRRPKNFSIRVHPEIGGLNGGIPQGNFCKVLQIKPGVAVVEQDIVLERSRSRTATIKDAQGRPVAGAWAAGFAPENFHPARQIKEASCSVYGEIGEPKLLVFYHPDKKLAGTRRLTGDEKEPIVVKLGPAGSIEGRLLDADGKPLMQVTVNLRYRDREAEEVHSIIRQSRQIVTDANGAFAFDAVIPELTFELSIHHGKRKYEQAAKPADPTIQVKPGECRNLGSIKLKRIPETAGE